MGGIICDVGFNENKKNEECCGASNE